MLQLRDICKSYVTGDFKQEALKDVTLNFRENEFVAVLGQSGSGKTTLLNIVGGLDRYDSGDLIINGVSTTEYRDKNWDSYRNHSVGFVFQTYNLIPHQSVLSNVELALTLSGVSKAERRARAVEVLTKVGLADQIHKRPNQMSGGQMQRVAIARALINNPDILLADEPTGALDSDTSVQIMDLLREIAGDRLIIMVTHNPELADTYASRIIRLKDGRVTDDSNPYTDEQAQADLKAAQKAPKEKPAKQTRKQRKQKTSMSFFTALALSLNNLLTKKTRTILTAFAGSIGIIGIALILALSNGIQTYINSVQEDTLSSYPITIEKEAVDMSSVLEKLRGVDPDNISHERDAVYSQSVMYELLNAMSASKATTNNMRDFKRFLESDEEIQKYLTAVHYTYDIAMNIYTIDTEGKIVKSDMEELMRSLVGASESGKETAEEVASGGSIMGSWANMATSTGLFKGMDVWEELLPGEDGALVSDMLNQQYELLYGHWPTAYNEMVLIVDENNEISDMCLYALGLKTRQEMAAITLAAMNQQEIEITEQKWSYDEILAMTFRAIPGCDFYQYDPETKTYRDIGATETGLRYLYDHGIELTVSGIVRQNGSGGLSGNNGAIGYTSALVDYMIDYAKDSDVVKAQQASPDADVLTGLPFELSDATLTDAEKAAEIKAYYESLPIAQQAAAYVEIQSRPSDEYVQAAVEQAMQGMTRETIESMMTESYAEETGVDLDAMKDYVASMDDETLFGYVREMIAQGVQAQYAEGVQAQLASMTSDRLAAALSQTVSAADEATLAAYYDLYMPQTVSDSTFEDNLRKLSFVDQDDPDGILLYVNTFENKDRVSARIAAYNDSVPEEDKISYTDYVALLMSSITTIINAISYVLIAFVAVSLVVSSIMIGIITYISVLERTKEIGVLRSIGASKRDVSRVFNAETMIVGLAAGLIGIGMTLLLCLPINAIVQALTGIPTLGAILPWQSGIVLVIISMLLTIIAGLIPAKIAAKKDPVVALRSE